MTPSLSQDQDLPLAERVAEMRKPEVRRAILSEEPTDPTNPLIGFVRRWDRIFATGRTVNYEATADSSIAELARSRVRTPGEVALTSCSRRRASRY